MSSFLWEFLMTFALTMVGLLCLTPLVVAVVLLIHWATQRGGIGRWVVFYLAMVAMIAFYAAISVYLMDA